MSENGFTLELNQRFDELFRSEEWRKKTLEQLQKDLRMAGVRLDDGPVVENSEDPFAFIVGVIQDVKGNKPLWDSINYRVDLPSKVDLQFMSDEDMARLYLIRSFQKVWLRHQFGDASAKDEGDSMQKHLKP